MPMQDVWQVDYVIMDALSGVADNNGGTDYGLPLQGAPSEAAVLDARAAAWEAAERERLQVRIQPSHRLKHTLGVRRGRFCRLWDRSFVAAAVWNASMQHSPSWLCIDGPDQCETYAARCHVSAH